MGFLDDRRGSVVAEAVDALTALKARNARPRVEALFRSKNPLVAGAALRFICRTDPQGGGRFLAAALKHPSYIVRENAADELDSMGGKEFAADLERLTRDPHKDVRQAARTALDSFKSR